MDTLQQALDIFLHLDVHLNHWAGVLGPWTYVLLCAIVFCETGLVVTPFLPGDSLLFAVGALAATDGSPIDLPLAMFLLCVSAIVGDAVNYIQKLEAENPEAAEAIKAKLDNQSDSAGE